MNAAVWLNGITSALAMLNVVLNVANIRALNWEVMPGGLACGWLSSLMGWSLVALDSATLAWFAYS